MNALTVDEFKSALPDKLRKTVSQELIDEVNTILSNPEEFENYRNNLISYTSVMADGKFTIPQYLDAVRYVSFKLMGCTNIDAYIKTFPARYQNHLANGTSAKDISSYVSAYNKSKLVNLIYAQTMIPSHVLNQDLFQQALNVQADLMLNANSEKVRTDAANSLLTHLKQPEVKKVELDITHKQDDSIEILRQSTLELVRQQRLALEAGQITATQAAHQKLQVVDVETKEIK